MAIWYIVTVLFNINKYYLLNSTKPVRTESENNGAAQFEKGNDSYFKNRNKILTNV